MHRLKSIPGPEEIAVDAPLFSKEIAALHEVSLAKAKRLLIKWEVKYGTDVVQRLPGRRGPRRFTTLAAMRKAFGVARLSLLDLLDRLKIVEDEQRAQAREIASLRDQLDRAG
jgi:hypothetical protein